MSENNQNIQFLSVPPTGPHTAQLWNNNTDLINKIFSHPFGKGLSEGTLPINSFRHYLGQDMLYIEKDALAFSMIARRAEKNEEFFFFLQMAKDGIEIERLLHTKLFPPFGIERPQKMSKACSQYTSFLIEECRMGSYESAVAALLPCFWVYHEAGIRIRSKAVKNNPYQLWIDTYADEKYRNYVVQFVDIVENIMRDSSEKIKEKMHNAFRKSVRFEKDFFSEALANK